MQNKRWQFILHRATRQMLFVLGLFTFIGELHGQDAAKKNAPAKNVILVTLDGLRGEEVFAGADKRLMLDDLGVRDADAFADEYWRDSAEERRKLLMPFLWEQIAQGGWIAGDALQDSLVQVTNGRYFSYPGYNELLCGFPDPRIDSNAKTYNENATVLEWLQHRQPFQDSVAAYCSWDVFPFIINDRRSGIPVNAGWAALTTGDAATVRATNFLADNLFHEWEGVRYDAFTTQGALQEMQHRSPRVLYVALGETDDWAHAGRYDRYILTAQQNDGFIRQLWKTAQELDAYRDQTVFIISSDHGRGDGRDGWKSHGSDLPGSERTWVAAFGVGLQRHGVDQGGKFTQAQIAATVAAALGHDLVSSDSRIQPALPIFSE